MPLPQLAASDLRRATKMPTQGQWDKSPTACWHLCFKEVGFCIDISSYYV